jgi:hypothetical protein
VVKTSIARPAMSRTGAGLLDEHPALQQARLVVANIPDILADFTRCQSGDEMQRARLGGMRRFAGIVLGQPLLQIGRQFDMRRTFTPIGAALLRQGFGGHPASRYRFARACSA